MTPDRNMIELQRVALAMLRDAGVTRATFSDAGVLTSVEFAPNASGSDAIQQGTSKPTPAAPVRSAVGRLVPRERADS